MQDAALRAEPPLTQARVTPFPAPAPDARSAPPLSPGERALLEELRGYARDAQLSAPMDPMRACRLIEPGDARAHGRALLRALGVLAVRPLTFHPRGAEEVGFDERWLLSLVRALETGDMASARLLIGGRTGKAGRRVLAWLARGYAERRAAPLDFGTIPD